MAQDESRPTQPTAGLSPGQPAAPAVEEFPQTELLAQACNVLGDAIFIKDRQHRWIACNNAFASLLGRTTEQLIGKSDPDYFPPEQVEIFWRNDDRLFKSGTPSREEEQLTAASGEVRTIWTRKYPIRDATGYVTSLCGLITDVTELKTSIQQSTRLAAALEEQYRIIQAQNQLLEQLAVPVIQIWEGILLLPIVGEITTNRGRQVLESLLNAIGEHRAQYALLDITGVPFVDKAVANYLVQSVNAARLLGCQSIMVGLGASVASQMVSLGIDFALVQTRSTLQQGLEYAMQQLSYVVRRTATSNRPR
jgi:rsbT co-antagonist protein RsbR